jgi:hypothetical protein
MRCEKCQGIGKVKGIACLHTGQSIEVEMPCRECGGTGVGHCCDGLCEQPEASLNEQEKADG